MRVSAPRRNGADGEALAERIHPRLRDAFGMDRLLWESDWPHMRFGDAASYERSRRFLGRLAVGADVSAALPASPRALFRIDAVPDERPPVLH